MVLIVECVSVKLLLDLCQSHTVTHRVHSAELISDLRQPHTVVYRVYLSQTVARSMSAT